MTFDTHKARRSADRDVLVCKGLFAFQVVWMGVSAVIGWWTVSAISAVGVAVISAAWYSCEESRRSIRKSCDSIDRDRAEITRLRGAR
jgi:hypothetical protein